LIIPFFKIFCELFLDSTNVFLETFFCLKDEDALVFNKLVLLGLIRSNAEVAEVLLKVKALPLGVVWDHAR